MSLPTPPPQPPPLSFISFGGSTIQSVVWVRNVKNIPFLSLAFLIQPIPKSSEHLLLRSSQTHVFLSTLFLIPGVFWTHPGPSCSLLTERPTSRPTPASPSPPLFQTILYTQNANLMISVLFWIKGPSLLVGADGHPWPGLQPLCL